MIRQLRSAARPLIAVTVATLFLAAPAGARPGADGPLYDYIYYDDAGHTNQVGYAAGVCYSFGPGVGPTHGYATGNYDQILVGQCRGGVTIYQ